jgi:antitoxin MazE
MPELTLKVTRIGNSRGVRIPARVLKRYRIGDAVVMEELPEGILLRPAGSPVAMLTWQETAREMARAAEDWAEWDSLAGEGLELAPWHARPARVAEPRTTYPAPRRKK